MTKLSETFVGGLLGGIVDKAVAPVVAACEVMTNGDVSDKTAQTLCKMIANDGATEVAKDILTKR